MKKSNFSNDYAISTIIKNIKNEYFKEALTEILKNIKTKKYMYKTMKNYSSIFPLVYINFIKNGELTNTLEDSFIHAIAYLEEEEKIYNKVKNELMPSIVSFIGIIFLIILSLLFGIPSLQNILASSGNDIEFPQITLFFMNILKSMLVHWYIVLLVVFFIIAGFIKYLNSENGKYKFDHLKYTNFLFGKLTYLVDFSRLIKSIFLNLNNKMRIQDALEITKNFTVNTYMISKIEEAISNVYLGKDWIIPFEKENIINSVVIEMIRKGQKYKSLDIFEKSIKYMDREIEIETDIALKKLVEISYLIVAITLVLFLIIFLIPCIHIYLGGLLFI